jgi:hypothetical protein
MRVCSRHYETLDVRACRTGFNLLFSQARLSFSVVIHEIPLSAAQRPVTLPPYGNHATLEYERPFGAGQLEVAYFLFRYASALKARSFGFARETSKLNLREAQVPLPEHSDRTSLSFNGGKNAYPLDECLANAPPDIPDDPTASCVSAHLNTPMMSNEHHRTGQIQLPIGRVVRFRCSLPGSPCLA